MSGPATRSTVLIGYDPDRGGDAVVGFGASLAEAIGAVPIALTIRPWPAYMSGVEEVQAALQEQMRERFGALEERFGSTGLETRAIAAPAAAGALYDEAERRGSRLIVVGSSHHGPLGRTLAGSAAESLLNGAPCGVVIVPREPIPGAVEEYRLERIAIAFDGSPESRNALETGVALAERSGAKLTLLSVADYPSYAFGTAWPVLAPSQIQDAERHEKQRLLDRALARVPAAVDHDGRVLSGDTAGTLAEVSGDFDLMLTGSRAYGPVRRTLLGSTTRRLVRSSHCPVLVLPRGVGIDPLRIGRSAQPQVAERA